MKALSLFLDRISNWKVLLVVIAIYISFPAYFLKNAEQRMTFEKSIQASERHGSDD